MLKGIKNVTVIEMARKMAQDVGASNSDGNLMKELEMRGIKLITQAKMKDIQEKAVIYTDAEGNDVTIKSDSVLTGNWVRSENSLAKALEDSELQCNNYR